MSLVRHSFSKSFSNYGGVVGSPKVMITALLMALLPVALLLGASLTLLTMFYPQLAGLVMLSPIYIIFVMPIAYILQTIYIHKKIRENEGLSSEVSGSLLIKYLKLVGYMILFVLIGTVALFVFSAIGSSIFRMTRASLAENLIALGLIKFLFLLVLLHLGSRLFAFPYILIIENEKNSITKSFEMTSEYSGKILGSILILMMISVACSYLGKVIGNNNMMTTMGINFVFGIFTMLFFNTFYINMYNRLKELNGESTI